MGLRKEEVDEVFSVSSCFVVDIKICDFVHSVRAEVFHGVELDIAFKALLQRCALIVL